MITTETLPNSIEIHTAENLGAKIQMSYSAGICWAYDVTYLGKHVHSGTVGNEPRNTAALSAAVVATLEVGRIRSQRAYDAVQSLAVHTRNDA